MSRPVTGRDAVSPLPDHRVATDQAAFGFSQRRKGFVEAALVGLFPKGLADVVPVLPPADRPLGHSSSANTGHYVAANPLDSSSLRLG